LNYKENENNNFLIMKIIKTFLILFIVFSTNSFAGMLQKSQGNIQSLPSNSAVTPTAQSIVINVSPNSVYASQSAALSITGAQGTATYSVTSGSCTISGSIITAGSSAGTCTVVANIPASTYFLASSATTSITVNALQNQTLTTVANPSSFNTSGNATLSTTGAQGSVSYTVQSGSCTISGSTVRASAAGTCVIIANAAATTGYLAGSATATLTVTQAVTADYTSGDWAYFNQTISINNSNVAVAQTKCSTLGAGWRLPNVSETWGSNGWSPPISAIWNVAYPSNGQTMRYILNEGGFTGHWVQQGQVRGMVDGGFNQYFSSTSYSASKIFCKRG
jgi:hypothetical protein